MYYRIFLLCCIFCIPISSKSQADILKLYFAGDAMQHKSQLDDAKTTAGEYDYSNYFSLVSKDIQQADIAVINLETPIGVKPYAGYPAFSAPIEFAESLKNAGFNLFLTANNHAVDKGKKGIIETVRLLDSLNVSHTGTFIDEEERLTYYPLMIIKNGIRLGILNYTYGTNGIDIPAPTIVNLIDTNQIKKDINDAFKLGADIIVANMHWGMEYKLDNNKEQEKLAKFLVKNGVRIIIGGHPHVVQPVNIKYKDHGIENIIVYSLGNYISGMKLTDTSGGMTVSITLSKKQGEPVSIDSFDYDLIWTHKPTINGKLSNFQLLKVSDFLNESGKEYLGEYYKEMATFARNAKEAIEKNRNK